MAAADIYRENGPYGSILVRAPDESEKLVPYQLQILMRQRPAYVLPCYLRHRAGLPQVCQEVTGLTPLDQTKPAEADPTGSGWAVLRQICAGLLDGSDRLLPLEQFTLHPSLIFVDQAGAVRLAFWPIQSPSAGPAGLTDLAELIRICGRSYQWPQVLVDECLRQLNDNGLAALAAYLDGGPIAPETADQADDPSAATARSAPHVADAPRTTRTPHLITWVLAAGHLPAIAILILARLAWFDLPPAAQQRLFLAVAATVLVADAVCLVRHVWRGTGRTISLSTVGRRLLRRSGAGPTGTVPDEDQTVLLTGAPDDFRMAMLCEGRPGTPEENEGLRAFILVEEFLIGRDPKGADLCLPDPGVGRVHARITRRAGSFFICDLGSRNGTSVDGRRLLKQEERLLPDRCVLQFADRSFYFQAD